MCWENYWRVIGDFTSYDRRLLSFKNWKGSLNPKVLAYAGFYFTQNKDICKCAYCFIELGQWEKSDCPIEEHQKFYKHCSFNNIIWKNKTFAKRFHCTEKCDVLSCNYWYIYIIFCIVSIIFIIGLLYLFV